MQRILINEVQHFIEGHSFFLTNVANNRSGRCCQYLLENFGPKLLASVLLTLNYWWTKCTAVNSQLTQTLKFQVFDQFSLGSNSTHPLWFNLSILYMNLKISALVS